MTSTPTTTRFAPSPTGRLHIGNLRAALLSWLTARKAGGTFILRIDDTDRERSKEEHVDAIRRDLEWLGLDWDRYERQSARMERYDAAAERWKAMGRLYACYETPTELDLKRKRQHAMGKPPVYDRSGLSLTDEQKRAYEAEGRRPHWRFLLDQERVSWNDMIRGETEVDCGSVSDPVLIREDGGWLYTPCSVVDDVEMGVTDVVRGEDHVTNTATQVQMIRTLGAEPPRFAHHSLLVGAEGEALSKRLGSLSLEGLRADGLEPMALLSLMARLGTADPVEPRTGLEAIIEGFDIGRFGRAPARFSLDELLTLNSKVLHETGFAAIADRVGAMGCDATIAERIWPVVRGNLDKLDDLASWVDLVVDGADLSSDDAVGAEDRAFVAQALALLPDGDWTAETWSDWTAAVKDATGRKGKSLFMPLRKAMTGRARGPEMAELMPLLKRPHGL